MKPLGPLAFRPWPLSSRTISHGGFPMTASNPGALSSVSVLVVEHSANSSGQWNMPSSARKPSPTVASARRARARVWCQLDQSVDRGSQLACGRRPRSNGSRRPNPARTSESTRCDTRLATPRAASARWSDGATSRFSDARPRRCRRAARPIRRADARSDAANLRASLFQIAAATSRPPPCEPAGATDRPAKSRPDCCLSASDGRGS